MQQFALMCSRQTANEPASERGAEAVVGESMIRPGRAASVPE